MQNPITYKLIKEVAPLKDFMRLREVSGLSARPESAAAKGLQNSLFGVQIKQDSLVVGMGRIIGDGGLNFDIVDVAVAPEHQGFGLGRMIMEALMEYLKTNATPGAYITLMADVPALYKKFGFEFSSPESEGMYYRWNPK